jgi:hypothetical protein
LIVFVAPQLLRKLQKDCGRIGISVFILHCRSALA